MKQRGSWARWLVVVAIALAIGAYFYFGLGRYLSLESLKAQRAALDAQVQAHYLAAIAAYFALYVAVTALSLPGAAVLTLAGGALFGLVVGFVVVSFASTIGATLAFLAARFVLGESIRARYAERLAAIDRGIERDGAFYLFTLRLVPLVPFFLVNLLMGLTRIGVLTFYGVSQLGMIPGTIVYVYAGTQLARIESLRDVASPGLIAAFVALGLLPLAMRKVSDALAARRIYRGFTRPRSFDYNLVVIGAGSAGLVSAYIGAALKARVALIEKQRMGGDCLNTGCVPSKALLRSAKLVAQARDSARYGIARMDVQIDFAQVMERVQAVIAKVAPHDSIARYTELGVEVIEGEARVVSPWAVEVGGRTITGRHLILASGGKPLVPPIDGLAPDDYVTSDSVWDLRVLPKRLVVLGGGPIGCELAQGFARLGAAVTLVEMAPRILPREDDDAAAAVASRFAREGITLALAHKALRVETRDGSRALVCAHGDGEVVFPFDRLLLALGRRAATAGFGLEALGVRLNKDKTVEADALMRTNFPNISVCGDAAGPYQFTHVASHQAWYAAVNSLLAPFWSFRADYRLIPWCTFCEPEVARVGLSEAEAREKKVEYEVTRYGIDDLDRAIADSEDEGFVKVLTAPGGDRILGATVVGAHAGELIAEWVLAMKHGVGLNKLLGTIHTYPTLMEANKYAAGVWKRAHAPQRALAFAARFFAWRRGGATPAKEAAAR